MKVVIQRVSQASVQIKNQTVGQIGSGFMILLGAAENDTETDVDYLVRKIVKLRIMPDNHQKMNLSITDAKGEILVVSQFTLVASTKKGNRPSFINAAKPELAKKLYQLFIEKLEIHGITVATGSFGAMMQISLVNDGPVTIILNSRQQDQ